MRWLVRVVGSLLVLALIAVAAVFLIPTETVAKLASAEFRKVTGRDLVFEGNVRPTVWPHLGVRTGAVRLANADWSDQGPMLTAQSLAIDVDMAALIGGTVRVTGIELVAPQVLLERAADGRVNWDFAAPAAGDAAPDGTPADGATTGGATATPFTIDRATVDAGTLSYIDHASGQSTTVTGLDLSLAIPDFQGAADLTGSATLNGQAVAAVAKVANFAPFMAGKLVPVVLNGTVGGSKIGFDGRMGLRPFSGEGALDATLSDLPALFSVAGLTAPDLPEGLGKRSILAKGGLTLTSAGSVHLRDGAITLDDTALTGGFDFVPGKTRPMLTAQFATGALNLAAMGGGGTAGSAAAAAPAASAWSTDRIDASGLGTMDAALSLSADSIDLGAVKLGKTRVGITLDAARAVVDLREAAAYGGAVSGQVVVNARKGLSTRADLSLRGLALQPLLQDLAGTDRLTGTGDIRFNVLASGGSMDALMKSLSGDGSFALSKGELRGFDLAGLLRALKPDLISDGSNTVFDSIAGTFTLAGGVLNNPDMVLTALVATGSGSGIVDIGGRSLDYRLIPATLGGQALEPDYQVPLRISGPWSAPNYSLDVQSIANRKLEAEAKKLEAKAKAEIAKKLQDELGITATEGESLEDTARRAADQAIQAEAERALNRLLGISD